MVRRLVDVGRVRIGRLRAHRLRIRVDVLDEPELLVLLVSGKGERHLLSDFGRTLVREDPQRSEEHTSELQSLAYLVCRLLLEKKKTTNRPRHRCDHILSHTSIPPQ